MTTEGRTLCAKAVGVVVAVATLALLSGYAGAAPLEDKMTPAVFARLLDSAYPRLDFYDHIEVKEKTVVIKKINLDGTVAKSLELNSVGGVVAQLCSSKFNVEEIVELTSEVCNIDKKAARDSVEGFLYYLYVEGYIAFGSGNFLTQEDKKRYCGLAVLADGDRVVKIVSESGEPTAKSF